MAFLTPAFAGGSFSTTRDVSVDFGSNDDRGVLVLVFNEGALTPGGTSIVSCAVDPSGVNLAMSAGAERAGATVVSTVGKLRAFWIASSSVPTGVKIVRVTCADGNGKPQVWALPFDGFSGVTSETLANDGTTTPSITVPSAIGSTVLGMFCAYAHPDGATMTPASPATLVKRVLLADNPLLTGGIWQEAGAASVTLNGTWSSPGAVWGAVAWSLTPGSVTPTAPSITVQPTNQSTVAGSTATFSVTATGTALTYQWQRNPAGAGSFADISGATSSTYTTPATTVSGGSANNTDTYRVIVTGSESPAATSNPATLTVSASGTAPSVTVQPVNATVTAGQTATFTAAFSGSPTPTVQWRRNGSNISGATNLTYSIATVLGDNGAAFDCVATNAINSVTTSSATLTVNAAAPSPSPSPSPSPAPAPGAVIAGPFFNNTLSERWRSVAVVWTWWPGESQRVGALTSSPIHGVGTLSSDGMLTTGRSGYGVLMVAIQRTDATDDDVFYQAF